MMSILYVAAGGAMGAVLRHLVGAGFLRAAGNAFPWATLCVNVAGSLAMGFLVGWLAKRGNGTDLQLFLATGVLGGFTTFSAFSLDALTLWQRGEPTQALTYVLASVMLSILAVAVGVSLARPVMG